MSEPINNTLTTPEGHTLTIQQPRYTTLTFALGRTGGCFSIRATETGFDVDIPEGVTMNECAESFINGLRDYMRNLEL